MSSVSSPNACPIDHRKEATATCPVDHAAWSNIQPHSSNNLLSSETPAPTPTPASLSTSRQLSSIPRNDKEKWVYPSEAQFYAAMTRKNHDPKAPDMRVVVPIHNAVNERAWSHIQQWEADRGGEHCGGIRLVSFKGRPGDPSPKAKILTLLGYNPPFDRHDWVVERCGTRMRYVIDFYAGRPQPDTFNNISFFLDVRPALDSWEAVGMRASMFVSRCRRAIQDVFSGSSSLPPASAKPDS